MHFIKALTGFGVDENNTVYGVAYYLLLFLGEKNTAFPANDNKIKECAAALQKRQEIEN